MKITKPKTKVVGVRLPIKEVETIDQLIERMGYENRSDGLRALLLSAVAFAKGVVR
jgi:metal-responsive CopG/Arc/MetJ family transcriptional regulator